MSIITAKEFAAMLNGREYHNELTQEESDLALLNRLVVVYGASDDLMEFEGAIDYEIDCWKGTTVYLNQDGIIGTAHNDDTCNYKPHCEFFQIVIKSAKWIKGIWREGEYDWHYETDIPHETFDILEEGDKYCKGIVFSLDDIDKNKSNLNVKSLDNFELYVIREAIKGSRQPFDPEYHNALSNIEDTIEDEWKRRHLMDLIREMPLK